MQQRGNPANPRLSVPCRMQAMVLPSSVRQGHQMTLTWRRRVASSRSRSLRQAAKALAAALACLCRATFWAFRPWMSPCSLAHADWVRPCSASACRALLSLALTCRHTAVSHQPAPGLSPPTLHPQRYQHPRSCIWAGLASWQAACVKPLRCWWPHAGWLLARVLGTHSSGRGSRWHHGRSRCKGQRRCLMDAVHCCSRVSA